MTPAAHRRGRSASTRARTIAAAMAAWADGNPGESIVSRRGRPSAAAVGRGRPTSSFPIVATSHAAAPATTTVAAGRHRRTTKAVPTAKRTIAPRVPACIAAVSSGVRNGGRSTTALATDRSVGATPVEATAAVVNVRSADAPAPIHNRARRTKVDGSHHRSRRRNSVEHRVRQLLLDRRRAARKRRGGRVLRGTRCAGIQGPPLGGDTRRAQAVAMGSRCVVRRVAGPRPGGSPRPEARRRRWLNRTNESRLSHTPARWPSTWCSATSSSRSC